MWGVVFEELYGVVDVRVLVYVVYLIWRVNLTYKEEFGKN